MKFTLGEIDGVEIISLEKFSDERGCLIETFRADMIPDNLNPLMSYVSYTRPGVSRGPHEHLEQTDIFSFIGPGNMEVCLWDNREASRTMGNKMVISAGIDNPITIIVPPKVVHGYKNVSTRDLAMVINYPDKLFKGYGKRSKVDEIRHENSKDEFYLDFMK